MSSAQVTFDDYAIPCPGSPQTYELNLGPGMSRQLSLYPHGHLDGSLPSSRFSGQVPRIPARPAHTVVVQQPDLMLQYHLAGGPSPFIDLNAPYQAHDQPVSPQGLYAATSRLTGPSTYGGYYNPASSAAFLQNLQSVIDSSHTVQTQQQNAANMAASAQPPGAAQSSWTGSIDLTTGVFQRSVEHPRLRTAQACEKCRIRKAKCTGENPCKRCIEKGLQCEYAPERKMRGPNKNKRKATFPKKRSPASSPSSDRAKPDSASTPTSSDSDSSASCRQRSESSPSTIASYRLDIPSTHSSPASAHRASPETIAAFRPRSANDGQNPSGCSYGRLDVCADPSKAATKPRPPHLDLSVPQQMYPRLLAEYARTTEHAPYSVPVETGEDSHTLLPTYLAEAYSRIALHNSAAVPRMPASLPVSQDIVNFAHLSPGIAGPSSFPPADQHVLSSSPEMSTPITPLSLVYDAAGGLTYPTGRSAFDTGYDSFEPSPMSSDSGHLGGFDAMADVLQGKGFDQDGWEAAAAAVHAQLDDDETPRASANTLTAELMGPIADAV